MTMKLNITGTMTTSPVTNDQGRHTTAINSDSSPKLKVGDLAPDFSLPTHNEGELNLGWYRGRKNVVLAFYPGDWTPVCAAQIPAYQHILDEFDKYNCQLLAISADSIASHLAWARHHGGFSFPLMSDYYPHGRVANLYGVLNPRGYAERALFLIDMQGVIQYIEIVEPAEIPDNTRLFKVLCELKKTQAPLV